jgi:hypothetical protein
MQNLFLLQQVAHTVASGVLNGFKLCRDGTNAVVPGDYAERQYYFGGINELHNIVLSSDLISNSGQGFSKLFTGLPLKEIYQFQHTVFFFLYLDPKAKIGKIG